MKIYVKYATGASETFYNKILLNSNLWCLVPEKKLPKLQDIALSLLGKDLLPSKTAKDMRVLLDPYLSYNNHIIKTILSCMSSLGQIKDVRAHCYCASPVRTLFIGHARTTSFSSTRTESKTQQNIELMTFALTLCANIFVGYSVTPTFFSADQFLF